MENALILKGEFQFFRSPVRTPVLLDTVCSSSSPSHRCTTKTNYTYDSKSWRLIGDFEAHHTRSSKSNH